MDYQISALYSLPFFQEELRLFKTEGHERLQLKKNAKNNNYILVTTSQVSNSFFKSLYKPKSARKREIAKFIIKFIEKNIKEIDFSIEKLDSLFFKTEYSQKWESIKTTVQDNRILKMRTRLLLQIRVNYKLNKNLKLVCKEGIIRVSLSDLSAKYPLSYFDILKRFKGKNYLRQNIFEDYSKTLIIKLIDILYGQIINLSASEIFELLNLLFYLNIINRYDYKKYHQWLSPLIIVKALIQEQKKINHGDKSHLKELIYDIFIQVNFYYINNILFYLSKEEKEILFAIEDPYIKVIGYMGGVLTCVKKDETLALLLTETHPQKIGTAYYYLGLLYCEKIRDAQHLEKAAYYFELAAEKGHAIAQCQLGWLYEEGKGVVKNLEKARHYYQLAVSQGNAKAAELLSYLYERGRGQKIDEKKASYYNELAKTYRNYDQLKIL